MAEHPRLDPGARVEPGGRPGVRLDPRLDPGLAGLLTMMASMQLAPISASAPHEARRNFRAMTCDIRPPHLVVPVGTVEDGQIPGPGGPMRVRTYRPQPGETSGETSGESAPRPTILFLHGGGWVIGDVDTHDNQARRICRDVDAVVVSVDYRLAPDAPFPAAVEDAWAALTWVTEHARELGGDADRVAVCGDSAGGNLAAVVARRARDAGGPKVAAQLLIYPGTDFAATDHAVYPSRVENADGYFLTMDDMIWFAGHYAGQALSGGVDLAHPDLSPLRADPAGLPPAVVVVAEFDPLRDEGVALARALEAAGTPVTLLHLDGMIHGFFDLAAVSAGVEAAVARTTSAFRETLERS